MLALAIRSGQSGEQALDCAQLSIGKMCIRDRALRMAHVEGGLTMSSLAREIGLSVARVSRLIAATEEGVDRVVTGAKGKA